MIQRARLFVRTIRPSFRAMSSTTASELIHFGQYEITSQVFYRTPLSYALVNIKPVLPGHVLIVPFRAARRLAELSAAEMADLFATVRRVQRMLAGVYFPRTRALEGGGEGEELDDEAWAGSFNVALQDGPESGQTVPHVHVHIIPRPATGPALGDAIYQRLQGEPGNVGGGYHDAAAAVATAAAVEVEVKVGGGGPPEETGPKTRPSRPVQQGMFPQLDDELRFPRSLPVMEAEAQMFARRMAELDG